MDKCSWKKLAACSEPGPGNGRDVSKKCSSTVVVGEASGKTMSGRLDVNADWRSNVRAAPTVITTAKTRSMKILPLLTRVARGLRSSGEGSSEA